MPRQSESSLPRTQSSTTLPIQKAVKSFVGYLEGTLKSAHTIKNYRLDLNAFTEFAQGARGKRQPIVHVTDVDPALLKAFNEHLENRALKLNTRRRMLLTVQRFVAYLAKRKKIAPTRNWKTPTPEKVEKIPKVAPYRDYEREIDALPTASEMDLRNRLLARILLETGAIVSEVGHLTEADILLTPQASVQITSSGARDRATRRVPLSEAFAHDYRAFLALRQDGAHPRGWLFRGFDKAGPRVRARGGAPSGPMTHRGIELLIKHLLGVTPRALRQSAAVHWIETGATRDQVQERLGLKTAYSLKYYEPWFARRRENAKSTTAAT